MPSDRLFRFSAGGMMFLASAVFFYFFFGGSQKEIEDQFQHVLNEWFILSLGLLFSTPIIGIIISTITMVFLRIVRGPRIHYCRPVNRKLIEGVIQRFPELSQDIPLEIRDWNRSHDTKFYPFYQIEVRRIIGNEAMGFLERRWSAYWTQVNCISSTVVGCAVILILRLCSKNSFCTMVQDNVTYKTMGAIFIVFYLISAWWHAIEIRRDAAVFEHNSILSAYRREQQPKQTILQRFLNYLGI